MSDKKVLPRVGFLVRDKKGLRMMHGPTSEYNKDIKYGRIVEPDTAFGSLPAEWKEVPFYFSEDGTRVAVSDDKKRAAVFDTKTGTQLCCFEDIRARAVALSPKGTYLVAWTKFDKSVGQNLYVYDVASKKEVARMFQKTFRYSNWPSLRWNKDESICGKLAEDKVLFYAGRPFTGKMSTSLNVKRVSEFAFSGTTSPLKVATFSPQTKGGAANVSVYLYPSTPALKNAKALNSRAFFKAEEGELSFSPSGNSVLCRTSTALDRSGGSYYGTTAGYQVSCMIGGVQDSCVLPEICHAAVWSPAKDEYIAITGNMPATVVLHDANGKVIKNFGRCARNTVCWSPHGRFFCIAGFGNLQGGMDFYDRVTLERIGQATVGSPATSWGWSPDSRSFLIVTQFPRMRQSVGFEMYTYRGDIIFREDVDELTQASWRPCQLDDISYPNRPPSPGRTRAKDISVRHLAKKAKRLATSKKYRPPHSTGRVAEMMRRDRLGASASKSNGDVATYVPPGASKKGVDKKPTLSKSAARNQRRRERKKAAESNAKAPAPPKEEPLTPEAKQKMIKKIKKKLRQIETLKSKDKSTLKPAQIEKLSQEGGLLEKLKTLSV